MKKQSKSKCKLDQGSSGLYAQEKGLCAVLVADLFDDRFEPLNEFIPPCLLPLNNVPLLHITLSTLIADGFKHILIYTSRSYAVVKTFVSQLSYLNAAKNHVNVFVRNLEKCQSLGDVMRDLESCEAMSGVHEFLLSPADLICATSLSSLMKKHRDRRSNCPNMIMSLLLPKSSNALTSIQASEFKVSVVYNETSENALIDFFRGNQDEYYPILLNDIMRSDQRIRACTDFLDIQLYICNSHIPAIFKDNFDYATMDDLIHDVLTNQEIMEYTIHVESILPGPLVIQAAPDLSSLIRLNSLILSRKLGLPLGLDAKFVQHSSSIYHGIGPYAHVSSTAQIDRTARIIGTCLIGSGCQIGPGTCLIDCVLGPDCVIGSDSCLRRVVTMERVRIGDNVRIDTSWICSQTRLLSHISIGPNVFIGPPNGDTFVTIGPGPGINLSNCVLVAPKSELSILDPKIAGPQAWVSFYSPIIKNLSNDPDDMSNLNSKSNKIWQTSWDRIKQMAQNRRRYNSNSHSMSHTDRHSLSTRSNPRLNSTLSNTNVQSHNDGLDVDDDPFDSNMEDDIDEGQKSEELLITEFKRTLERAQTNNYPIENTVLEINSLKHAYNVSVEDLCFFLTKSLLDLTSSLASTENVKTLVKCFREILKQFGSLFQHCTTMIGNPSTAGRLYLQALEDTACYNERILDAIPYIIHGLYDADVLLENDIWWWRDQSPLLSDEELDTKTQAIRNRLTGFFEWLEHAEEEEDDEND